jgi:dGTPase
VNGRGGAGTTNHNRLTNSLEVTAGARDMAVSLRGGIGDERSEIAALGECDPVVQAAASAHDLGHPPFGHLGEQDSRPGHP